MAALAAKVRDTYRVGSDSWDGNAAGVYRELTKRRLWRSPQTGPKTAVWILERSLADFRWDVAFWSAEQGGRRSRSVREAVAAIDWTGWMGVNPADGVSGFHPYIHLMAALKVLSEQPRPESTETLTSLLEYWLALAEHRARIRSNEVALLEALVRCYQATPATTHSRALIGFAHDGVTCKVTDSKNVPTYVEGDITYVTPVSLDRGAYDLSALARAATRR
ncbi:hypothetical protein AB1046_06750 [Promicromonospora sp. Populi]|uniref:hypothetical protein n=1 Tax=Promicromonospora sp. Populi TaxID=3239420 RepID=UPI0034E1A9B2